MDALNWATLPTGANPPSDFYCATRDVGQARVQKFAMELIRQNWNEGAASLVAAAVGELVGNCFDHNLGKWRDVAGCWFETSLEGEAVRVVVVDRGQGVLSSLRQALPELQSDKEALLAAFTQNITGRAPEPRGNGLKFVLRSMNQLKTEDFRFLSGTARLHFTGRVDANGLAGYIDEVKSEVRGTYVEFTVRKKI